MSLRSDVLASVFVTVSFLIFCRQNIFTRPFFSQFKHKYKQMILDPLKLKKKKEYDKKVKKKNIGVN